MISDTKSRASATQAEGHPRHLSCIKLTLMEQQIHFCTTSDGVRIAYATAGHGPPLVMIFPWVGHLQFEWDHPSSRLFFEGLARQRLLVRFDKRGTGLSDRNVEDLSLEGRLRDLDAVLDALSLDGFALMGASESGPAVLTYAAHHPDRVSRIVIYGSFHRWPYPPGAVDPLLALIRAHWGAGSAALSALFVPSGDPGEVTWFSELQRVSASPETAASIMQVNTTLDVTSSLKDIAVPTLIVHRREDQVVPFEIAREMAALIPGARLHSLEGNNHMPWFGDSEAVVSAINQFLGEDEPVAAPPVPSGMTAILFADIVDSTALTERLGDAAFRDKARDLDAALRAIIRDHEGTPIAGKLLGDGVLATFASARQAMEAALACGRAGDDAGLPLHLGLHAGDVIREEGNVFGGAVNIASRISGLSAPGEVLVSDTVRSLARTSAGVTFEDAGERVLKGVSEPVRVWRVGEA